MGFYRSVWVLSLHLGSRLFTLSLLLMLTSFFAHSLEPLPSSCQTFIEEVRALTEISHLRCQIEDLTSLNDCLQENWKRPPDAERWEMSYNGSAPETFQAKLKEFNFFDPIYPEAKTYDYAVVLGATIPTMRDRLGFLLFLYRYHNVRFKSLFLLGADRPTDPGLESLEILLNQTSKHLPHKKSFSPTFFPQTETEGWYFILAQAALPKAWEHIPTHVLDTSKKPGQRRPQTHDTILTLLEQKLPQGTYLFISSQPFVLYQYLVIHKSFKMDIPFEVVGDSALIERYGATPQALAALQDNLARIVYETVTQYEQGIMKTCPTLKKRPQEILIPPHKDF